MRIAFIPPYSLLEATVHTNYQLMLPQCVNESEEYAVHYRSLCNNPHQYVILDNGAAEGISYDWTELIDMAYRYSVDEIVIPDTLGDAFETIDKAESFRNYFLHGHPESQFHYMHDFNFMFVIQGSTPEEVIETGLWAAKQDWITSVGIPRHMLKTLENHRARTVICNKLTQAGCDKEIHFLGADGDFPTEMQTLGTAGVTNQAYVRGMDTSMPFNFAFKPPTGYSNGMKMTIGNKRHRPENYFNLSAESFDPDILGWNLAACKSYSHGRGALQVHQNYVYESLEPGDD